MLKPSRRVHLEVQTHRANPVGVLRSSFREGDKIKHTNHGRITGLSLDQLRLIQAAFRGDVIPKDSPQAFQTINSREYGASYALLHLAKELGLDKALYSRNEPWVQDCLAMIVGRILYAGSELALSNQWKNTALWELCGVEGPVDVEAHCYGPMDRLLKRQKAIQRTLASKHLQNGHLVLYDITSTTFEGAHAESQIMRFGYNRDGKQGHEQVVIGLLCNADGCPVGVEVFAGNTQAAGTVLAKVQELKRGYGLKEVTFVGDRGMITQTNAEQLKEVNGLHTISALGLSAVEQAFRNLKTVSLEVRPVYHKKTDRIRSHVFLCVLALHVQWHMQQRLQPLFAADGEGKNRQWTVASVIARLMSIRKQRVQVSGVEFDQVTQADQEQQKILDLLQAKL